MKHQVPYKNGEFFKELNDCQFLKDYAPGS